MTPGLPTRNDRGLRTLKVDTFRSSCPKVMFFLGMLNIRILDETGREVGDRFFYRGTPTVGLPGEWPGVS